ncbi:MAG: hypothetical protein MJB12_05770 [Firmicutes bacterium]|nr:hypothetical protein [Bacillota bacterium]
MKKLMSILYFFWIAISVVVLITVTFALYPVYEDSEFPLFIDISLTVFLPSFFALAWLTVHFVNIFIKKQIYKIVIGIIIIIIAFTYSITLMEFSLFFRVAASVVGVIIAFIHYFITEVIYRKSLLFKENV